MLVIGSIPGAVIGALAESKIEALFHEPGVPVTTGAIIALAVVLALLGAALLAAERLARHVRALRQLTLRDAILIGLAQALAVFPGVSRSGATITAGLGWGSRARPPRASRSCCPRPSSPGAGAKSLYDIYQGLQSGAIASADLALFPIGFIAAAISGYLCIRFLLAYLQRHSTEVFVYYRWALAVLIVIVALTR